MDEHGIDKKILQGDGFGTHKPTHSTKGIRWSPLQHGWTTPNSDGCLKKLADTACCGGLLRNHNGDWKIGYSVKLGTCSIEEAEMWALIYGLRLAWEEGIRFLVAELDSKTANTTT